MHPWQVITLAVALSGAFALQGAVGFGAGLVAIPLLLWAGFGLPESIAAVLVVGIVQTAWNCWQYRGHIAWRSTLTIAALRLSMLPAGYWLMTKLDDAGRGLAKQVVGVTLVAIVLVMWLAKIKPRDKVHWAWVPTASITSGLMAGAIGMGGPPVVLYSMAHDWPAARARAFLWLLFLTWMPCQLALLLAVEGGGVAHVSAWSLLATPLVLVATRLGNRLGDRLNRRRLRVATFALLLVLAVASIVMPMLTGNGAASP